MAHFAEQHQKQGRSRQLQQQFLNFRQAHISFLPHGNKVIQKPNDPKNEGKAKEHQMGIVSPGHGLPASDHTYAAPQHEDHTAHGGSALLGIVPGRSYLTNALSYMQRPQGRNNKLAGNGTDHERQHTSYDTLHIPISSVSRPS